jgi:protein-S-isoprenylcysteine O-methyltransferase Ste14
MHQLQSDTAQLPVPPPFVFLAFLVVGLILSAIFPIDLWPTVRTACFTACVAPRLILSMALVAIGFFIASRAFRVMIRARTPIDPFEPTSAIVSDGPYRFSRNPIYLSLSVAYLGIAVALNAAWAIALWPIMLIVVTYLIIVREEKYLEGKFGAVYTQYKSKVRRWI